MKPTATPLIWTLPPAPPHFTGRADALDRLLEELQPVPFDASAPLVLPPVLQLCGLAGVGKTALAAHLCATAAARWPGGIVWLSASPDAPGEPPEATTFRLHRQLAQLARRLHLDVARIPLEKLRARIGLALGERGQPCLWVVDGLPAHLQDEALAVWLAPHPIARCLLTARTPWADLSDHVVTLQPLPAADALALVDALTHEENAAPLDLPEAVVLGLGGLPLAIVLAAPLWRSGDLPADLPSFTTWRDKAYIRAAIQAALHAEGLHDDHARVLGALLTRAAAHLQRDAPLLAALLGALPQPRLTSRLLHSTAVALSINDDDALDATDQALDAAALWAAGLLSDAPEALTLSPLVARALRAAWSPPSDAALDALLGALHATLRAIQRPRDLLDAPEAPERALALAAHLPAAALHLLHDAGGALLRAQLPALAAVLLRRALDLAGAADDALRRQLLLDLARAALDQGDLDLTADLQREALDLTHASDASHDDLPTVAVLEALAHTSLLQGDHDAWRQLAERALDARAALQGDLDLDTLAALDLHVERLNSLGAFLDARALLEATYDARWQHLGPDHPATLTCARNLAFNRWRQGEVEPAHHLFEQVLERRRVTLGAEHPDTLAAMTDLAELMRDQGWLGGARALLERTLDLRRKHLGDRHPDVALSMNDLAVMLWHLGDIDGARDLEEAILDLRYHDLGPEDPLTLTTMNNLAVTLRRQGELDRARLLLTHVLELRRAQLGPDHPDTLAAMNNLAITLWEMGELQEAGALEEDVFQTRLRDLGPDHPDTLAAMSSLASTLLDLDDPASARDLEAHVLETLLHTLGPEHPDTLASAAQMHRILLALDGPDAAADLLADLNLDPDTLHPRTPAVMVRE